MENFHESFYTNEDEARLDLLRVKELDSFPAFVRACARFQQPSIILSRLA